MRLLGLAWPRRRIKSLRGQASAFRQRSSSLDNGPPRQLAQRPESRVSIHSRDHVGTGHRLCASITALLASEGERISRYLSAALRRLPHRVLGTLPAKHRNRARRAVVCLSVVADTPFSRTLPEAVPRGIPSAVAARPGNPACRYHRPSIGAPANARHRANSTSVGPTRSGTA